MAQYSLVNPEKYKLKFMSINDGLVGKIAQIHWQWINPIGVIDLQTQICACRSLSAAKRRAKNIAGLKERIRWEKYSAE